MRLSALACVLMVGCVNGALDDDGVGRNEGRANIFPTEEELDSGLPCHPGAPGCEDAGQPPGPDGGQQPPPGQDGGQPPPGPDGGQPPADSCTWKTAVCSIKGCNGHDGSDEAACTAAGNSGGCTAEVFKAWCTRRVPGSTLWDDLHERWVNEKCGVTPTLTENTFSARNEATCLECKCTTPLVLSFDGGPVKLLADDGSARFDLSSRQDGSELRTDWPAAENPWLALDRDGDGVISSGRELFGSATTLGGGTAANGFEALAALDDNVDGVIDARDAAYARLRLWSDRDHDRVSSPGELRSLAEAGVEALELHYVVAPRCDARGNCEVERATFRFVDSAGRARVGALVDVHLAVR